MEVHGTHRADPEVGTGEWRRAVLHRVDLTNANAVRALLHDLRPAIVHHLAAQSSVSASLADPGGTLNVNAGAQRNLLEGVAEVVPDATVLIAGSCDEYGDVEPEANPVAEEHELRPLNPYALSKVVQDLMGYQYHATLGLHVVRVRPFLQLGPRRQDRFVAGSFARQIAEIETGARRPVIEAGNIDLQRDFTDVRDVARAMALLARHGVPGQVYNIASGVPHTLREMLAIMASLAGVSVDVDAVPHLRRHSEPPLLVGNAGRLRRLTGWKPEISFEQSVKDTLDYWRERVTAGRASKGYEG